MITRSRTPAPPKIQPYRLPSIEEIDPGTPRGAIAKALYPGLKTRPYPPGQWLSDMARYNLKHLSEGRNEGWVWVYPEDDPVGTGHPAPLYREALEEIRDPAPLTYAHVRRFLLQGQMETAPDPRQTALETATRMYTRETEREAIRVAAVPEKVDRRHDGAWVPAWVWVPNEDMNETAEDPNLELPL